jgi:hypothetical protein
MSVSIICFQIDYISYNPNIKEDKLDDRDEDNEVSSALFDNDSVIAIFSVFG